MPRRFGKEAEARRNAEDIARAFGERVERPWHDVFFPDLTYRGQTFAVGVDPAWNEYLLGAAAAPIIETSQLVSSEISAHSRRKKEWSLLGVFECLGDLPSRLGIVQESRTRSHAAKHSQTPRTSNRLLVIDATSTQPKFESSNKPSRTISSQPSRGWSPRSAPPWSRRARNSPSRSTIQ